MVLDAVSNFVRGTTDAAVDSSQTTVSVADASIFPDPSTEGEYNVVIWDAANFPRPDQDGDVEILRVTAIDTGTNTLTVTRAQETTAAAAHPSGSAVHLSPTAKMFSDVESTFADFWDSTAQELTADVNNQSVNTEDATIGENSLDVVGTVIDTTTFDGVTSFNIDAQFSTGNYQVILEIDLSDFANLMMTFNDDTGSSAYTYYDATGTENISGEVLLTRGRFAYRRLFIDNGTSRSGFGQIEGSQATSEAGNILTSGNYGASRAGTVQIYTADGTTTMTGAAYVVEAHV